MTGSLIIVGGQYYWTSRLAPKKYARFLSYSTGYLGWAGAVVVSGSVAVGLAQAIVGMIILANPDVLSPLASKTTDVNSRSFLLRG